MPDRLRSMTGRDYMTVTTEHQFAQLLGQPIGARGEAWDADVWRSGNKKKIESALRKAASHITKRQAKARKLATADLQALQAIALAFSQEADNVTANGSGREDPRWLQMGQQAQAADQIPQQYGV